MVADPSYNPSDLKTETTRLLSVQCQPQLNDESLLGPPEKPQKEKKVKGRLLNAHTKYACLSVLPACVMPLPSFLTPVSSHSQNWHLLNMVAVSSAERC